MIDPKRLSPVREELHRAAQLVSVAGRSYLAARPDDSHSSFTWSQPLSAMFGEEMPGRQPFRFALAVADRALMAIVGDVVESRFELPEKTLGEAEAFIRGEAKRHGLDPERFSLAKPYELSAHALDRGGRFELAAADCEALAGWWALADRLLREVAAEDPLSSDVRVWPHHFDIGLIVTMSGSATVGFGLSPGDASVPEPYFYVNAWPAPSSPKLPALEAGRWNTEGWFGAVLTATDATVTGQPEAAASAFLAEAGETCRQFVGSRA